VLLLATNAISLLINLFPLCLVLIGFGTVGLITRPQSEVVSKELHDKGRVLVGFFVEGIELGNGVIKCVLGDRAGLVGSVEDLVVKDGEVEGQSETDGMRGRKIGVSNSTGGLVGIQSRSSGFFSCVTGLEFGKVSVVISLHLVVEYFGFFGCRVGDQAFFDDSENVIADFDEFAFDLGLVVLDDFHVATGTLLFDAGDNTPRGTSGSDDILVGNTQKVAFLDGEFLGLLGNLLPEVVSNTGNENKSGQ